MSRTMYVCRLRYVCMSCMCAMHICMLCVCIYVSCMYVYIFCVYMYVCMDVCIYVCMYVCMYACMFVCLYACTSMYVGYNCMVSSEDLTAVCFDGPKLAVGPLPAQAQGRGGTGCALPIVISANIEL